MNGTLRPTVSDDETAYHPADSCKTLCKTPVYRAMVWPDAWCTPALHWRFHKIFKFAMASSRNVGLQHNACHLFLETLRASIGPTSTTMSGHVLPFRDETACGCSHESAAFDTLIRFDTVPCNLLTPDWPGY